MTRKRAVGNFGARQVTRTIMHASILVLLLLPLHERAKLAHTLRVTTARPASRKELDLNNRMIARLESQRRNVEMTLEHLREQQSEANKNMEWSDLRAQRRRHELLEELLGWYDGKLSRIDRALNRIVLRRALRRN